MTIPFKMSPLGRGKILPNGYIEAEFLELTNAVGPSISVSQPAGWGLRAKMAQLDNTVSACVMAQVGWHMYSPYYLASQSCYVMRWLTGEGTNYISPASGKVSQIPQGNSYMVEANYKASGLGQVIYGSEKIIIAENLPQSEAYVDAGSGGVYQLRLFPNVKPIRVFRVEVTNGSQVVMELLPCLNETGQTGCFDVKTETFYKRTWTLGMTLTQARNLRKLPATGGTLTVSLPWESQLIASGVPAILQAAADAGWTITVQYREPEADNAYYNKYAQCETFDQIKEVNPNFRNDKTADNGWIYPLTALKDAYLLMWGNNLPAASLSYVICDAPNVTKAHSAFPHMDITYFEGDWHNVTNADCLFHRDWVSKNVLTLKTTFPALSTGLYMFNRYALTKESALLVLNSIPAYTSGSHKLTIGIHVDNQTDEEVIEAITNAEAKGWTLAVQWNGTPGTQTASTFGLRTPPIYAKLGTVERPDGTSEQILDWGHYVSDWEANGYREFGSVEEAKEYFNIIDEA